jgi:hypothetical protein
MLCGGACVSYRSDPLNCGACGRTCAAGTACLVGMCRAVTPPANDTCAGARDITARAFFAAIDGATHDAPSCGPGPDLWFRFTLATRELVYLDTFGSAADTQLGLATACGAAPVACDDDSCGARQSRLVRVLDPGTYYVVVDVPAGASGSVWGRFEHLPVTGEPAGMLGPGAQTVMGTTVGAPPPPTAFPCGGASSPARWYYWASCPRDPGGALTASSCNTATSAGAVIAYQSTGEGLSSSACGAREAGCATGAVLRDDVTNRAGLHVLSVSDYRGGAGAYTLRVTRP